VLHGFSVTQVSDSVLRLQVAVGALASSRSLLRAQSTFTGPVRCLHSERNGGHANLDSHLRVSKRANSQAGPNGSVIGHVVAESIGHRRLICSSLVGSITAQFGYLRFHERKSRPLCHDLRKSV